MSANRFDRMERAGAFGDLGTLIPFVVAFTGIFLGLGLGFILQGVRMMAGDWWLGGIGLAGTLLLLRYRGFLAMFVLPAAPLEMRASYRAA